jgi:hypothetical protein
LGDNDTERTNTRQPACRQAGITLPLPTGWWAGNKTAGNRAGRMDMIRRVNQVHTRTRRFLHTSNHEWTIFLRKFTEKMKYPVDLVNPVKDSKFTEKMKYPVDLVNPCLRQGFGRQAVKDSGRLSCQRFENSWHVVH